MRHAPMFAIIRAFASACAIAAAPPTLARTANIPAAQLHTLFDKVWNEQHVKPPAGSTDCKLLWGDPSITHAQAQLAQAKANLAALKQIDRSKLDPTDPLPFACKSRTVEICTEGKAGH